MAYQVLARKWRPQDFSSVIGQDAIVTALRNALTEGRIAPAYLFSGIRGVGKTTAARVFAKALNCERGPAADPCNECTICREITAGSDLDVIEVDAATYSKVEQVRDLTESLRYGPTRDRYKVVVLDEIHRLSRAAFDALLKIVEEPPPGLVFIFATTEIDAVPATILSRCQEFHFRRVPAETVAGLLAELAEREGIEASEAALRLIARAGEGSVRDSVALLDQLATFSGGEISDEDAARLLGGMDTGLFADLFDAILAGERATISRVVHTIEDEGWDVRHVYAHFLAYGRDALHLAMGSGAMGSGAMGGGDEGVDLPADEAERLASRAREAGFENLLRLLQQLLASEPSVRSSDFPALAAEIAWLRAAELPRLTRVEEILASGFSPPSPSGASPGPSGGGAGSSRASAGPGTGARSAPTGASIGSSASTASSASAPRPAGASPGSGPARTAAPPAAAPAAPPSPRPAPTRPIPFPAEPSRSEPTAAAAAQPPAEPTSEPTAEARDEGPAPAAPAPSTGPAGSLNLDQLLEEVAHRKPPLAAHLRNAQDLHFRDGTLTIVLDPGDDALRGRLARRANREVLDGVLTQLADGEVSLKLVDGEARDPAPRPGVRSAAAPDPAEEAAVTDHETVQAVLEIFNGTVESVEPYKET